MDGTRGKSKVSVFSLTKNKTKQRLSACKTLGLFFFSNKNIIGAAFDKYIHSVESRVSTHSSEQF